MILKILIKKLILENVILKSFEISVRSCENSPKTIMLSS